MTIVAVYCRLNANFLTRLQIRNIFTNFFDYAAEFVTQCQWGGFAREAMWAARSWDEIVSSQVFVKVSSAYTDVSGRYLSVSCKYIALESQGTVPWKADEGDHSVE